MTNILRLEQILSLMLADTMLLKPERCPKAHVGGTDEQKGQVYGISGEFQRFRKSPPLNATNVDS